MHSGPDYLKHVCKRTDGTQVNLLVSGQTNPHVLKYTDATTWIGDVKKYLLYVNGELVMDKNVVFVIESEIFLTNTVPQRAVSVMVRKFFNYVCSNLIFNLFNHRINNIHVLQIIYDGEGKVIKWIIVSEGSLLTYEWTQTNECDALFLKSTDGTMTSTTLRNALILLMR